MVILQPAPTICPMDGTVVNCGGCNYPFSTPADCPKLPKEDPFVTN